MRTQALSAHFDQVVEDAASNLRVARSWLASASRGAIGRYALEGARTPRQLLVLFDRESSPDCRAVREALSHLDLDVFVYPCGDQESRHMARVVELGRRAELPFLVDAEAEMHIYGSRDIVPHLYDRYAAVPGRTFIELLPGVLQASRLTSWFMPEAANGEGRSTEPQKPLELWTYEWSPAGRLVRLELSQMEMPYVLHNAAVGSRARRDLRALHGDIELPVLKDPSVGLVLGGLGPVLYHLRERYQRGREALPA